MARKKGLRGQRRVDPSEIKFEQKVDAAVRCVYGESSEKLGEELGVSPEVVEGWVDRVGELLDDNTKPETNDDIQRKADEAHEKIEQLLKQREAMEKLIEIREVKLRMLKERPAFMKGGSLKGELL